jgi:NADPH:quinone reductase-like Zn-dependent oxidoreductase
MRALVLTAFGGPDRLRLLDVPVPVPSPDEVLVRVMTVAANRMDVDVMLHRGIGLRVTPPQILGLDPAGVVEDVGSAVDDLAPGDRVVAKPSISCGACRFCEAGDDDACERLLNLGVDRQGGFAEFVAVPRRNVVRIPAGLDFAEASALAHAAPVALLMLRERAHVTADDTVLVTGAGGAIGSAAVQIARLFGARVVAAAGSPGTVAWSGDLVPGAVVDYTAETAFADHVRRLAGGDITVWIESAGNPAVWTEAMRTVGRRARIVVCGSHANNVVSLDLNWLYRNRLTIIGSSGSSLRTFRDAFALAADGAIRANVHAVLPLEAYAEAYALLRSRANCGKVVLRVA